MCRLYYRGFRRRPSARLRPQPMSQSEGETDVAQAEDADGQEAQEVEADESETEVEEPAEPAGTVAETSAYGGGGYRIIYSCSRASVCCLCQAKSTDPTPLDDPGMDGVIPWAKYRKMQHEGETVRVPEGKIDLICLNVFRATGSFIKLYKDFICTKKHFDVSC